jgi:hypothetical protein
MKTLGVVLSCCLFLTGISLYRFKWHSITELVMNKYDQHYNDNVNAFNESSALDAAQNQSTNILSLLSIIRSTSAAPNNSKAVDSVSSFNVSSQFQPLVCLKHEPIIVEAKDVGPNGTTMTLEMKMRESCGPLRRDWTNNPPLSPMGQMILQHQSNCTLPVATWDMSNHITGIGSHIAHWSQILCHVWGKKMRLRSYNPEWMWLDQTHCDKQQAQRSPWSCYFPFMENLCDGAQQQQQDPTSLPTTNVIRGSKVCWNNKKRGFYQPFRAGTVEYIFRSISPLVIQEAQRQVGVVFGPKGAPKDLITVHVRWGDKFREMKLVTIEEYVNGVWKLLLGDNHHNKSELGGGDQQNSTVTSPAANIYLATEDPLAVEAFTQAAPKNWNIFVDVSIVELTPFRPPSTSVNPASIMAQNTRGRGGLVHMASLLVSMEANDFVLATGSTFGRVMNNIRTNIIDPRCGGCTRLVDVQPGEWVL